MKDRYQSMAEELALSKYRQYFYDMPDDLQREVYNEAMDEVYEQLVGDR